MHLAAACATVQQSILVRRGAEHADLDFGDGAVTGRLHGVDQIQRRVTRGPVTAALAADQHDRHGTVLHHEAEDGRRMPHCIGAVSDHDAVRAGANFLTHRLGQRCIVRPRHVLGEDAENLLRRHVGDLRQLGHGSVKFTGREGRDHGSRAIVQPRRDRASGSQQRDVRQVNRCRKHFFGNLIDGLFMTDHLDRGDAIDVNTHVVPGLLFQHDVQVVGVLAAGKDHSFKRTAGIVHDQDVTPHAHSPLLKSLARQSTISFQVIRPVIHTRFSSRSRSV
jgi:hypothetical protein